MLSIEELQAALSEGQTNRAKPLEVEFSRRVSGLSDCWLVVSHFSRFNGTTYIYPQVSYNGHKVMLSRLVKFIEGYDLSPNLTASHLCETVNDRDSFRCINPDHIILEPLRDNLMRSTRRKEAMRGNAAKARAAIKNVNRDSHGRYSKAS